MVYDRCDITRCLYLFMASLIINVNIAVPANTIGVLLLTHRSLILRPPIDRRFCDWSALQNRVGCPMVGIRSIIWYLPHPSLG